MTRFDVIDLLVIGLLFLAVALGIGLHTPRGLFALGFRYDFVPLVAFLILRRVPWSDVFQKRLLFVLIGVGSFLALFGIVSLLLPTRFFVALGYADVHSLYVPGGPLSPYQQIAESWVRRVQSTMSGPNQLGVWMLLPLSVCFSFLASWVGDKGSRGLKGFKGIVPLSLFTPLILLVLFLTFSRAAWIGAFVMAMIVAARMFPPRLFKRVLLGGGVLVLVAGIAAAVLFPSVFFRLSSSRGHLVRPMEAAVKMLRNPFGLGLGAAGPASNRVSEPCVFLRPQDDPAWAKSQPNLCVFLGSTQVQPTSHACKCPFLPENWYLQVGVELGVLGFALFVSLVVLLLRRLGMENGKWKMNNFQLVAFLSFLGISIAALFLHAWEDAAVAYTGWILVAVALAEAPSTKPQ